MADALIDDVLQGIAFYVIGRQFDDSYMDDPDYHLLKSLVDMAYSDLRDKTGVDWSNPETEKYDVALDTVRAMVYLSYYGNRDDSKNVSHLKQFIASKIFSLMYSNEAVKARADKAGSESNGV